MNQVLKNGEKIDFKVDAGSTWRYQFTWNNDDETPIDLTGYIIRMQFRRNYNSPVSLSTSSTSGEFTISINQVTFLLSDEVTSTLSGSYIYDVEAESFTGEVTRLYEGSVTINPEVTR